MQYFVNNPINQKKQQKFMICEFIIFGMYNFGSIGRFFFSSLLFCIFVATVYPFHALLKFILYPFSVKICYCHKKVMSIIIIIHSLGCFIVFYNEAKEFLSSCSKLLRNINWIQQKIPKLQIQMLLKILWVVILAWLILTSMVMKAVRGQQDRRYSDPKARNG